MLTKLVRSIQVFFPSLQHFKEITVAPGVLKVRRIPHESDFKALRAIALPANPTILDVGANLGQSIRSIRLFVPQSNIIAFEPNPLLAAWLRQEAFHDVVIHQYGLGMAPFQATLFVPIYRGWEFHGLASTDRVEAAEWLKADRLFWYSVASLKVDERQIEVMRLDDVPGIERVDMVKIDTQGTETDVLEGSMTTLRRDHPALMVEAGRFHGRLKEILFPLGYRPYVLRGDRLQTGDTGALNTWFLCEQHVTMGS